MDLWDLTKLMFRRWYIALPMLVVSLIVVLLVSRSVRPDYSAKGHVTFIPPASVTSAGGDNSKVRNPWYDLGYNALGQAVILQVQNKAVLDTLKAQGYTDTVTVTMDLRTPIFEIEAVGATPQQATGTVQQVMKRLDEATAAAQRQYGVTSGDAITTHALDSGEQVTVVTSKVKRVLIVALGLSLLLTAATTIGIDALLRRRARASAGPAPTRQLVAEGSEGRVSQPVATGVSGKDSGLWRDVEHAVNVGGSADKPVPVVEYVHSPNSPTGDDAKLPVSVEQTIVLPLTRVQWAGNDDEGKRH